MGGLEARPPVLAAEIAAAEEGRERRPTFKHGNELVGGASPFAGVL